LLILASTNMKIIFNSSRNDNNIIYLLDVDVVLERNNFYGEFNVKTLKRKTQTWRGLYSKYSYDKTSLNSFDTDRPTPKYGTLRLKVIGHWTATRTIIRNGHNTQQGDDSTRRTTRAQSSFRFTTEIFSVTKWKQYGGWTRSKIFYTHASPPRAKSTVAHSRGRTTGVK